MNRLPDELVVPEPNSGCWLWIGPLNWGGYGRVTVAPYKRARAHRISYEDHKGSIPRGLEVLHRCDVRCCVNPNHLYLGTQQDNLQDMRQKGRQARGEKLSRILKSCAARGEQQHCAKLKADQVRAIIDDHRPQRQIAKDYGINQQHVSRLKRRKAWGHLHA